MKQVKNKMTGDIGELDFDSKEGVFIVVRYDLLTKVTSKSYYKNLKDLNEEWEDYEEPKEYWYIDWTPEIGAYHTRDTGSDADERQKEIGNYFETKEEAEKAVERLRAWKRLKDKGVRFNRWTIPEEPKTPHIKLVIEAEMDVPDSPYDLDLLFGGEE